MSNDESFPQKLKADLAYKGVDVSLNTPMSEEELTKVRESLNTEANMKARFEYLDAQTRENLAEEATVQASYHHSKEQDVKEDRAKIEASAAEERKVKLDPLELLRQVEQMRKEGFDESTIRAAFNEVMEAQTGNFRRPIRRVLKSEGMIAMLSPQEMNKHYTNLVYPPKGEETDSAMDERIRLILERMEQTKDFKVEYKKPTIKNYIFRAILFVVRRPLQFTINFLHAYRTAKYQTKNGVYRK